MDDNPPILEKYIWNWDLAPEYKVLMIQCPDWHYFHSLEDRKVERKPQIVAVYMNTGKMRTRLNGYGNRETLFEYEYQGLRIE